MDKIQGYIEQLDKRFVRIFIILLATTLALLPVSPLVMSYASRDSGVFLYVGWRILHGEVPYLNVWDHKTPIIFFLDALGILLTPNSLWGVWLVEWLSLAIAVWFTYKLLKSLFGFYPTFVVLLILLVSFTITLAGGNLTEEYTLPFQFLSLYLFLRQLRQPARWHFFALGLVAALAFLIRQNSIALILAIVISIFIMHVRSGEWKSLLLEYLQMALGALVPIAIVLLYFARVSGGLAAFWNAAFVYNFVYSGERTLADRVYSIQHGFEWLGQTGLSQLALLGCLFCIFWLVRKPQTSKPILHFMWTCILAMPLEVLFVSITGRPRIPYYLTFLPIFSIFAAFLVWRLKLFVREKYTPKIFFGLGLVALIVCSAFLAPDYVNATKSYHLVLDSNNAVKYIQANTSPDDYVLMWGAETTVNFLPVGVVLRALFISIPSIDLSMRVRDFTRNFYKTSLRINRN